MSLRFANSFRLLALLALFLAGCTGATPSPATGSGPFLVFFQEWSAALDDPARATIGTVATRAKADPGARVVITGYADPTGSVDANADLTRLRARLVSDTLEGLGIPAARIERRAAGSVPFAGTAQESRRVEIRITNP